MSLMSLKNQIRASLWVMACCAILGAGSVCPATTFSGINVDADPGWDRVRLILGCDTKPSFTSTRFEYLSNPARVRVTLSGSLEGLKEKNIQVGDSFLKNVVVNEISRGRFQITAYLAASVDHAEIDYYDSSRMNFAYIDIPRPSRYRQPWWTFAEVKQAKDAGIPIVVIDPGHGGYDSGAISKFDKSVMEKEIALDISHAAVRALKKSGKVYPVMTRSGDYYPTLDERVELIRNTAADLFVSVHADSAPDNRSANGFAVWTLDRDKGTYKNKANQTSQYGWKNALDRYPRAQQAVMMKRQASFVEQETEQVAKIMTSCMDRVPNLVNRGIKPHDFNLVVLRHDYSPSILIEAGFLSHSGDSKKLSNRSFRERIGQEIANGVEIYFQQRSISHRNAPIRPRIKVASFTEDPAPRVNVETFEYRVKSNETLSGLAQRFNVTKDEILIASGKPLTKSFLYKGEVLRIPARPSQTSMAPPNPRVSRTRDAISRIPDSLQMNEGNFGLDSPGTQPYEWARGDSLLTVSLRYGVSEEELLRLNGWPDRYHPVPGETIRVPEPASDQSRPSKIRLLDSLEAWAADETEMALQQDSGAQVPTGNFSSYRVRPGDTLSGVASTFGASIEEIKELNDLRDHLIVVGQDLRIPANLPAQSTPTPLEHAIRRGESLEKLAKQYGTSVQQIKELNGLKGDRIQVGEVLRVR